MKRCIQVIIRSIKSNAESIHRARELVVCKGLVWLAINCLASTLFGSTVTFSDGTFNDNDWTTSIQYLNGSQSDGTVTYGQQTSGGNPGSYRSYHFVQTSGDYNTTVIYVIQSQSLFNYDPQTQGAIQSLLFSFDHKLIASTPTGRWEDGVFPVVIQDGTYYMSHCGYSALGNWTTFSSDITQETPPGDLFTWQSNPDFSAAGSTITFGFAQLLGYSYYNSYGDDWYSRDYTIGVDDFSVAIISAVPEPATLVLLGVGAASLLAYAWRRRRQGA